MPDGKIYLSNAFHWKMPLDSAECRDGHFQFHVDGTHSFIPFRAVLHFSDSSKTGNVGTLVFRNHMLGIDSIRYSMDAFYVEPGHTLIEGDIRSSVAPRIFAGRETDIMFSNQLNDFGWVDFADSAKRFERIALIKDEIIKYPYSYFLLESIFQFRQQYSKEEISAFLAAFNESVRNSRLADTLRVASSYRPGPGEPVRDLYLLNPGNQRHHISKHYARINMLVFWASWCAPCRREVPVLKEIHSKFNDKGVNLISISIDKDKEDWENAVAEERMEWPQYIIDADQISIVQQQYNFSDIPFVVFVGSDGREIKRFTGNDAESRQQYINLINETLSTK